MLLWADNFADMTTARLSEVYDYNLNGMISTDRFRSGGRSLRTYDPSNRMVGKNIPARQTVIVGFGLHKKEFSPAGRHYTLLSLRDSAGAHLFLVMEMHPSDGNSFRIHLTSLANNDTTSLQGYLCPPTPYYPINVWHYFELKAHIDLSDGSFTLIKEGDIAAPVITFTGARTRYSANDEVTQVRWHATEDHSGRETFFDDIYICDTLGDFNNDFLRAPVLEYLAPTADGILTDFVPNSGSDRFSRLGSLGGPNLTTFVTGSQVGDKYTVKFNAPASEFGILGVMSRSFLSNPTGGTRRVRHLVKKDAEVSNSAQDKLLTLTTTMALELFEVNPITGLPWTNEDLANGAEFGWEITV